MRKIHLFDIPLYHPDGFKHVGDRKIRLYDPVDAVIAVSYTHLTLPTNREV